MSEAILNLLVQVPLVGVFVAFTLITGRAAMNYLERRDTADAERRKEEHIAQRTLISEMYASNKEAMNSVVAVMRDIHSQVEKHNLTTTEQHKLLMDRLEQLNKERLS